MLEIIIIATLSVLIILLLFFKLLKIRQENLTLQSQITEYKIEIEVSKSKENQHIEERQRIKQEYQEQILSLEKSYQQNLQTLEKKLQENYQNQNTLLLHQNKNMLNEDSKKILNDIFTPIKEQIKGYTERLTQNETQIQTQIKHMFDYSQTMSANAEKLAQILKGDKKTRGNFGELQLKHILENSGLIEGEQYKLQENLHFEGSRYIPDAIIYLEKEKSIIIDSKFSLPNSFAFENINNEVCMEIHQNLKKRIDELAKKPYSQIERHCYDFVLLFIPYQNILDLVLEVDNTIYQYAYEKKVYLTTPHTLFMALKTISITWLNIKRNENVLQAFEEIGKMYDKFAGTLESFEDMQTHLQRLQNAAEQVSIKLTSGKGNLRERFQQLQTLGVRTKKELKKS